MVERAEGRGDTLHIGVLGRFEVRRADRIIEVGPLKQRCLLALLALRPNEVVSREEIVDVLWGQNPPASCHNLVHTYVSRLRKMLGAGPVSSERGGYLLTVATDQLDLLRFDRLFDRREPDALEEALRLWRGPVLADLPDGLRQHPVAVAAGSRRLAAALAYGDAAVRLGQPEPAVELLRAVGHTEPLHEGLHARIMLAMAASGQQAAALRLFTTLRTRLVDDLGIEPGTELSAAHLRVLRQDVPRPPGEQGPEPVGEHGGERMVPAQLPTDIHGFAGRVAHLAELDAIVREGRDIHGPVVISAISGTAGVGKTTLAVHWAHRIRGQFPDGQLYVNLRGYAPTPPMRPMEALSRFLRALGVPPERVPTDEDEAAGLYRTLLAERRVLVVLDNAADADQVRRLLPGSSGCLALVTSRDRLAGLMATEGAQLLSIDVLNAAEARTLLAGLLGADRVRLEREAVDELSKACAYLPLALRIAAANLSTSPGSSVAAYTRALRERGRLNELAVDGDRRAAVRGAFDLSYSRLDATEQRMFRLLGLVPGGDFTAVVAAALLDVPTGEARAVLARLVRGSLLHEHATGRYQFHDLLREYAASRAVAEEHVDARYAALTRCFDQMLWTAGSAGEQVYADAPRNFPLADAPPVAAEPIDSEPAAVAWLDAERANLVAYATIADRRMQDYSWRLADVLRGYFTKRGHGPDGLTICHAALVAATRVANKPAQAAVHDVLGQIYYNLSSYADAVTHYERAHALRREGGDLRGEAHALHSLGRVYSQLGHPATASEHHEQALEISRRIGNPLGEALALNYVGVTALSLGQIDKSVRYCGQAFALGQELANDDIRLRALHALALANWAAGDLVTAREIHAEVLRLGTENGWLHVTAAARITLAEACCDAGDYAEATIQARIGQQLSRELGERRHDVGGLEILGTVSLRTGSPEAAIRYYTEALQVARTISFGYGETSVLIGLAAARRAVGQPVDAISLCREALGVLKASGMRLLECAAMVELAAAQLANGQPEDAARQAEQALALAGERGQRLAAGRAHRVLGHIHEHNGDHARAAEHWHHAADLLTASGTTEAHEMKALLTS